MKRFYISARVLYNDMGIKWSFKPWFSEKCDRLKLIQKDKNADTFRHYDYERRPQLSTGGRPGELIILTEEAARKIVQSSRFKTNYQIPAKLLIDGECFIGGKIAYIAKKWKYTVPALKKLVLPLIDPSHWYENRLDENDMKIIEKAVKEHNQ